MKIFVLLAIAYLVLFPACSQNNDLNSTLSGYHNKMFFAVKPGCTDTLSWIYIKNDSVLLRQNYWHPNSFKLDKLHYALEVSTNKDSLYLFIYREEVAFGQDSLFQEVFHMGKQPQQPQRVWIKQEKDALLFVYQKPSIAGRSGHENVFNGVRLYLHEKAYSISEIGADEMQGKFILPKGFIGVGMIALNQTDGVEAEYDSGNNPIYRIGDDGLLSTQHTENPFMIAKGAYHFYYNDKRKQNLTSIHALYPDCRQLLAYEFKLNGTLPDEKYKLDEVYFLVSRYNPGPNIIDEAFGKRIIGNVKVFRVDTLRNLLGGAN